MCVLDINEYSDHCDHKSGSDHKTSLCDTIKISLVLNKVFMIVLLLT